MKKEAISVTLGAVNLRWLRGRVGPTGARSVSEVLDRIVGAARQKGTGGERRSVAGSIEIAADDPALIGADDTIRAIFERSLRQPLSVPGLPLASRVSTRRKPARRA